MATVVKDLGAVTAYAYAVAGGYTGTEAEFEALLGNIAEDLSEIENLSVSVTTLPAGSSATASYSNGVLSLGIPKGDKGDKGNTGATGATGPTGNGISTITKTGTSGLVDTYTITFTNGDTTTFTVTNGEDGEVTTAQMNSAIETALEDYAKADGSYSSLTAGNAEQLVSTVGVEDKTPYLFRTTGGSADVGDRVKLSEITGGTVAWNQLVQNGNFADTTGWVVNNTNFCSFSVSDNIASIIRKDLDATNDYSYSIKRNIVLPVGHKYFLTGEFKIKYAHQVGFYLVRNTTTYPIGQNIRLYRDLPANTWTKINIIAGVSGNPMELLQVQLDQRSQYGYAEGDIDYVRNINVFDLTAMFGSTIADYIYGLETNTAGAGVAWFRKLFPKDYYEYDAGSLLSVKTSAHKEVGFNQLDKSTGVDGKYINTGNGGTETYRNGMWHSDYIRVVQNTVYYTNANGTGIEYPVCFFDANKNYIGRASVVSGGTFNTGDAYYVIIQTIKSLTPVDELVLNISWDGERDGEYEPYEANTYALDDVELRGIPKLDANNNLYYDGDSYAADGTVTRKYGVVTLDGSKTYYWNSNNAVAQVAVTGGIITNAITQYNACTLNDNPIFRDSSWATRNNSACIGMFYGASYLFIKSSDITSGADAKTYFTNHPTTVLYLLATPTTESADPYQETQICNDFGTEEFVDSRTVPMPVGANALYQANLRAKLEMAPDSPSGDGDYLVRQTDGLNEYVALSSNSTISGLSTRCPACPTDTDGTFVLKATVSSGAVTYEWTAE